MPKKRIYSSESLFIQDAVILAATLDSFITSDTEKFFCLFFILPDPLVFSVQNPEIGTAYHKASITSFHQ